MIQKIWKKVWLSHYKKSLQTQMKNRNIFNIVCVLVIDCCVTNHRKTYWHETMTVTYYAHEFVIWIESGVDSSFLLHIAWLRFSLGLNDLFPGWLTHQIGQVALAFLFCVQRSLHEVAWASSWHSDCVPNEALRNSITFSDITSQITQYIFFHSLNSHRKIQGEENILITGVSKLQCKNNMWNE